MYIKKRTYKDNYFNPAGVSKESSLKPCAPSPLPLLQMYSVIDIHLHNYVHVNVVDAAVLQMIAVLTGIN